MFQFFSLTFQRKDFWENQKKRDWARLVQKYGPLGKVIIFI